MGLYYSLAARWSAEAMLSGSETMLTAYAEVAELTEEEAAQPQETHPLATPYLVIVDSRGQIRTWRRIQHEPYWRNVVLLCSHSTPRDSVEYARQCGVECIVAGDERVDLRAALEELNARYGIATVRVDSGGRLNGALLRAGLVDEVSVLIHPCLVGGTSPRSIFVAPDLTVPEGTIPLKLIHLERLQDDILWLRYEVSRK
jgi:2,5-diamino-6-(ribosylamino)-4(3H)-pyrimidinone 5'-phosphate reductase